MDCPNCHAEWSTHKVRTDCKRKVEIWHCHNCGEEFEVQWYPCDDCCFEQFLYELLGKIDGRIETIERELWWHIDKNFDYPHEAVLSELRWIKSLITEKLSEG